MKQFRSLLQQILYEELQLFFEHSQIALNSLIMRQTVQYQFNLLVMLPFILPPSKDIVGIMHQLFGDFGNCKLCFWLFSCIFVFLLYMLMMSMIWICIPCLKPHAKFLLYHLASSTVAT